MLGLIGGGGLVLFCEGEGLTKGSDRRVGMMQEDEIWYLLDTRTRGLFCIAYRRERGS